MTKKKDVKRSPKATLAGVKKEMGKPRVARSAQKGYENLCQAAPLSNAGKPPGRQKVEDQIEGEL